MSALSDVYFPRLSQIKASTRSDLVWLIQYLTDIFPEQHRFELHEYTLNFGLMRTHWWVKLCFWIIEKCDKFRSGARAEFFRKIHQDTNVGGESLQQLVDHILTGKDTEDKDSVGGFSQREIDLLVSILLKFPPV